MTIRNFLVGLVLVSQVLPAAGADSSPIDLSVRLTVTSVLPFPKVPLDPTIDFAALIQQARAAGVLDPNSIHVVDVKTGQPIRHALTEDFAYADKGRVEWVIQHPSHKDYQIRFQSVPRRPLVRPAKSTPLIGVGDLLRFNANVPRPIALPYLIGLADLNGDGRRDLIGCWNYAYRPGEPWDGIVAYPRVGRGERLEFGDLTRLRFREKPGASELNHFRNTYMHAALADFKKEGRLDLVYSPRGGTRLQVFLNSGQRDPGGMPIFLAGPFLDRQTTDWEPIRAVDLNQDGAVDLVINKTYLKNTNPKGWPITLARAVTLSDLVGRGFCFQDVDGDGRLDAVCLVDDPHGAAHAQRVAWQKNLGGDPPQFGKPQLLAGIDCTHPTYLAAVNDGPRRGLLVQHTMYQNVSFYERTKGKAGKADYLPAGRAVSDSAVLALGDQAWPCLCDWDGDGTWDLLVGGGYGWPRILLNKGSNDRPAFDEPQLILSQGKPIRLLRDEILGGSHWHNMGYPYPTVVDWDGDGLLDLLLPNETNRIFWYRNVGTRRQPKFGPRQQLLVDGYPDSPEKRSHSAKLAKDEKVPNHPYPYEKDQPFFWRTGAGFADLNGDGLMDLVTHDGHTRKLTLFTQYYDKKGRLRLKKDRALKLVDGRLIDDAIVGRKAHWTESFRCVDWDGDGLIDLIYSCAGSEEVKGSIYLLRNCGTKTDPVFANPVTLCCFGKPIYVTAHGPHPWVADLDGDGKPDLLTCVEWSVYPFYSHAAMETKERPTYKLGRAKRR